MSDLIKRLARIRLSRILPADWNKVIDEAIAALRELEAQQPVAWRKVMQEMIDLCALGDVNETTEAYGWGAVIAEAKALLAAAREQQPVACGVVGEPEAGRKVCELPTGHDGYHRQGRTRWIGYHPKDCAAPPAQDASGKCHCWQRMTADEREGNDAATYCDAYEAHELAKPCPQGQCALRPPTPAAEELAKDAARLDWCEQWFRESAKRGFAWNSLSLDMKHGSFRAAIDAAIFRGERNV